jgi:hypothetical protein
LFHLRNSWALLPKIWQGGFSLVQTQQTCSICTFLFCFSGSTLMCYDRHFWSYFGSVANVLTYTHANRLFGF